MAAKQYNSKNQNLKAVVKRSSKNLEFEGPKNIFFTIKGPKLENFIDSQRTRYLEESKGYEAVAFFVAAKL